MGFLSQYNGTEEVDLGDGYWVQVRKYLTAAQSAEAEHKLIQSKMTMDPSEKDAKASMETSMDTAAFSLEQAAQAVVKWNLTDEDNMTLPFDTVENRRLSIARLPAFVIQKIIKAVDQGGEKTPEDKATFHLTIDSGDQEQSTGATGTVGIPDGRSPLD